MKAMTKPLLTLLAVFLLACAGSLQPPEPPELPKNPAPLRPPSTNNAPSVRLPPSPSPIAAPPTTSTEVIVVRRTDLEKRLANVTSLADVVQLRPNLTLHGLDGIVITGIPKGSPLAGLGLRSGDIVHVINGQPLTSMDSLLGLASLESASTFTGDITRDGRRQTLIIRLK